MSPEFWVIEDCYSIFSKWGLCTSQIFHIHFMETQAHRSTVLWSCSHGKLCLFYPSLRNLIYTLKAFPHPEWGDMYVHMGDSYWCMAETNTILQSNYPPIKNKYINFKNVTSSKSKKSNKNSDIQERRLFNPACSKLILSQPLRSPT